MSPDTTEDAPRLRAFLRIVLSGGVWAVIAAQLVMLFLLRGSVDATSAGAQVRLGALVAVFFALLFLIAGASQGLAKSRETVSVGDVLRAGRSVYGRFLWLALKAAMVFFILFNLLLSVVLAVSGMVQALYQTFIGVFPWLGALVAFVFVYWMPVVFVRGDFGLLDTLRTALAALWHDRRNAGFLALLTLTPTVIAALLGASPPWFAVVALNVAGAVLGWTAYAYCVARLQRTDAAAPVAAVS